MRLIRRAIGNRKEYEEVMRTLGHMSDIYITKDTTKVSIIDPDAHNMLDKR